MNWGSTWEFLWHFLIIFAWIAYLLVLFQVLVDLLWRDHTTRGWIKAVWVIVLIAFPWLGVLIYLAARGHDMTTRVREAAQAAQNDADARIWEAGVGRSPAQEIEHAKQLLDAGIITQPEFETLKARALA